MRTYVSAKIHGIRVTGKSVHYNGSVSICEHLMGLVDIKPHEQVHLVNLTTGARWVTYALPAERGVFTLNGGGARLGEVGDEVVILAYQTEPVQTASGKAMVVFCDRANQVRETMAYQCGS